MLKRYLLFPALAVLALGAPLAAHADDQVRSAQESLKSQGFYDGPVDGELNPDTKGAIRRYQMRNGLNATGELTQETVTSLGSSAATQSAPAPQPQAQPPVSPEPAPVNPPTEPRPEPPSGASDPAFARLYAHGPYASAPAVVQHDTLRKAQAILARNGFYRGELNGLPGPDTEEALIRFQSSERLPRTACLDIDTLARLHLLPVARVIHSRGPEGQAPRGYPPGEGPAVRGIPAD
jgi:peptidoglycan hydrolase-like protein with peptidoglycan-binding domain